MMHRFYLKGLLVFLFSAMGFIAQAQQDAQFSQFMFNRFFINPAYAGLDGDIQVFALHRSQWVGYNSPTEGMVGAPSSQVFSINSAFPGTRSGAGLYIANDNLGALTNFDIQLSYAYHIPLTDGSVSLGVRGGWYSQTINFNRLRWDDPSDPLRQFGSESQTISDFGAGVFVRKGRFSGGLSWNHVTNNEFDFGDFQLTNPLEDHLYLMAFYAIPLSPSWELQPGLLVKSLAFNTTSVDLNVIATYENKIWGGASIRNTEAVVGMVGYSLLKDNNLRIGYAFDYVIEAQQAKAPTSHEFLMNYTIPKKEGINKRKIVRTPRFRF
jgi:type IX secretion system PorP/SprF family membrane protein